MNNTYLLFPIIFITLFLYAIASLLVKINILSKKIHRKFWNSLLALTFLVAAILGLILTYQVNSKIEFPYIKQILKWHVNFGIGMSVTGIIHSIWHWNYYKNIFTGEKRNTPEFKTENLSISPENKIDSKTIILSILLTGFNAIIFQVVILREMMNIFSGNELIAGLVLATWMGLTGIGSLIGKKKVVSAYNKVEIIKLLILLAILPIIIYTLIYITKWLFFPPGVLIEMHMVLPFIILALAPYCILSGHIFLYLITLHKLNKQPIGTDKLYAFETIGSLVGGICISFIFIVWISAFHTLIVLFIIQLSVISYLHWHKPYKSGVYYIFSVITGIVILFFPVDKWMKSILFPNQEIIKNIESPYGNILLTRQDEQYNLYTNHNLLFSSENIIENEENVHYAMLQHSKPENVLVVSNGNTEILSEITKYQTIKRIDFLLENKWLLNLIPGTDSIFLNKKIHLENTNVRRYLKKNKYFYDIILITINSPITLQTNRFFTYEFFKALKAHTHNNSIISIQLASTNNYPSDENIALHSLIFQTLKAVFKNCIIVPGEKDYFLASQVQLSPEIGKLSQEKNLNNQYINPYYIDDLSLQQRSNLLLSQLKHSNSLNGDFKPKAVFLSNNLYLSIFSPSKYLLFIPVILLLLPLIRTKKYDFTMYATGFSISSFQIIMLMAFQITFGYVYAASGIIFATCMAGLAGGAYLGALSKEKVNNKKIIITQTLLGISILILTFSIINIFQIAENIVTYTGLLFSILVPSVLTGLQFSYLVQYNKVKLNSISGKIYALDLFGSALGAYITSVLLIPTLGFINMAILIVLINTIILLVLLYKK